MKITCSPVSARWAVNHLLQDELGVFYFAPPWKGRYGMYGSGNGKYLSTLAGKKLAASEKSSPLSQPLKVSAKSEVGLLTVVIVVLPGSEVTLEDVKVQYEAKDGAAGEKTAENKEKK